MKTLMAAAALLAGMAAGAAAQQEGAGRPVPHKEVAIALAGPAVDATRPVQLDANAMAALRGKLRGGNSMVAQQGQERGSISLRPGGGLTLRLDRIGAVYSDDGAGKWVTTYMIIVDSSGAGQAAMSVAKYAPDCGEVSECGAPLARHLVPLKPNGEKGIARSILRFWTL